MELTKLKGIGPKTAELFARLGITTCEELIHSYPIHYDAYEKPVKISEVSEGSKCAIMGMITGNASFFTSQRGVKILSASLRDDTGNLRLTWYNMPFIRSQLIRGSYLVFRGVVRKNRSGMTMEHPEIFTPDAYDRKIRTLTPVYSLTKGLSSKTFGKMVVRALEENDAPADYLPEPIRILNGLCPEREALYHIHFPENQEDMLLARKRLVFDEFFLFTMAIRTLKRQESRIEPAYCFEKCWETEEIIGRLPYELTGAQLTAWHEIENDLSSGRRMSRLLQGDVGSGKTIVAFLALAMTAENGCQGALMAPTEVLARQHFKNMQQMVSDGILKNIKPVLVTGSMKAAEKRRAWESISSGEANVIIGTHALIQNQAAYHRLALVVTDEQHRFGVHQRQELSNKGKSPHMLVMSATPIPRTMGVVIYSDMEVSIIDEMPGMRRAVKTAVVDTSYRPNAYRFIKKEIDAGHQIYVVCPMIEETEGLEAENVRDYAGKLEKILPGISLSVLHGRMTAEEKDRVMTDFARGNIRVLVATTVIEVGIDVPNATVMLVENAERFGLATLHQLRGRVGRGSEQSYCIFMAGSMNPDIRQRLDVLAKSHNGLEIARKDLELRGSGDLLGIRQSGDSLFKIADVFKDADILRQAADTAEAILQDDPYLTGELYADLSRQVKIYLEEGDKNIIL